MGIEFYKYHALGNDYIVIDPNKTHLTFSAGLVQLICHRNFGVGSDGILLGPIFEDGQIKLRILNPDGSEAEKSGNGIRIFSRYLVDAGYVKTRDFFVVTLGGTVSVELLDDVASLIRVDMGVAAFDSETIPVSGPHREVLNESLTIGDDVYSINCVSVGNPHCVIPLPQISAEVVKKIGPIIENHPMFPNRINLQLLKILDKNNIQIEIWERGAGYTMASGSSSCAAASVAYKLGLTDHAMKVHMPGGIIDIDIRANKHVLMTGTVSAVMQGTLADELYYKL